MVLELQNNDITQFKNPNAFWNEFSIAYPFGFRAGFREVWDQNTRINFNGSGSQRGEIFLTQADFGIIAYIPIPFFQPWGSAGLVGGTMAVTNPSTRGNNSWLAAFENETRWIRGTYLAGGVDLVFGAAGFRVSYQQDSIETESFRTLNNQSLKFKLARVSLGLLVFTP